MASAVLWGLSWLRFILVAGDHGSVAARFDRRFWYYDSLVEMLDASFDAGVAEGFYPVRVIRAALAPYYPKKGP